MLLVVVKGVVVVVVVGMVVLVVVVGVLVKSGRCECARVCLCFVLS